MSTQYHLTTISDRVDERFKAKLIGRFFDITDQEDRDEFAIWLTDLLERLGIEWTLV